MIIYKILLITCPYFTNNCIYGQYDTIFIYEEVVIYDTIHVTDTVYVNNINENEFYTLQPRQISIIAIDTIDRKGELVLIYDHHTATIPVNGIILNEKPENLISMKKINLLGIAFFTFQSISFAQTEFGISIGSGAWWAHCNDRMFYDQTFTRAHLSMNYTFGLYYKHRFQSNLTLETGLNYQLRKKNKSYVSWCYQYMYFAGDDIYIEDLVWDDINSFIFYSPPLILGDKYVNISSRVGYDESGINYNSIDFPVLIGYAFNRVNPYLGFQYSICRYSLPEYSLSYDVTTIRKFKKSEKPLSLSYQTKR